MAEAEKKSQGFAARLIEGRTFTDKKGRTHRRDKIFFIPPSNTDDLEYFRTNRRFIVADRESMIQEGRDTKNANKKLDRAATRAKANEKKPKEPKAKKEEPKKLVVDASDENFLAQKFTEEMGHDLLVAWCEGVNINHLLFDTDDEAIVEALERLQDDYRKFEPEEAEEGEPIVTAPVVTDDEPELLEEEDEDADLEAALAAAINDKDEEEE